MGDPVLRDREMDEKPAPSAKGETTPPKAAAEEPSTVEVWHWKDVLVMPFQKTNNDQLRKRNMPAAWHLDTGAFVQLGKDPVNEQVVPIKRAPVAYVAEWSKYAMDRTIGRPAADLYLQDLKTACGRRSWTGSTMILSSPGRPGNT